MKLPLWEQIERRLHLHAPPAPEPSDEAPQEQAQGSRFRAWMTELSEDLVNIDHSTKEPPPGSH
ncbi:hypothetical protein [Lysobacter niastensis]|uniref:Uncharacterized protein n=1 Tax=Lysobacter niastensis TaxID=380629 RepID=A0ABS0BAS7_9GAMM|nr:hypothetical protein [Lysobacter niastensis]MBF6024255.1 hypothetical protein [Lysobacter niastensis]